MSRLNGRVQRLEAALPPETDEDEYTLIDLSIDVLAAIDAGHIVDYPPEMAGMFLSPTVAAGLIGDERNRVYSLLYQAQRLVRQVATITGWRSPLAADDFREWKGYRANSAAELAGVMRALL